MNCATVVQATDQNRLNKRRICSRIEGLPELPELEVWATGWGGWLLWRIHAPGLSWFPGHGLGMKRREVETSIRTQGLV